MFIRSDIYENLKMALQTLRANKLRAASLSASSD